MFLDKDDDADSQPNTYDYNDSFIDDAGTSDSSESYADPCGRGLGLGGRGLAGHPRPEERGEGLQKE